MRKEKELLQLMLEHQDKFEYGLCGWIFIMYGRNIISEKEYHKMNNYISFHRPKRIMDGEQYEYSWTSGIIKMRITWINNQIKRLEQIEEDNKNGYVTWVID
jgi:hypothetical protein